MKSHKLKPKAIKLLDEGKTQKEITQILGITEKTAGAWLKPYKRYKNEVIQAKTKAIKRLNNALETNAPTNEIKALAEIVAQIKAF